MISQDRHIVRVVINKMLLIILFLFFSSLLTYLLIALMGISGNFSLTTLGNSLSYPHGTPPSLSTYLLTIFLLLLLKHLA
jgi:hypothetical protein